MKGKIFKLISESYNGQENFMCLNRKILLKTPVEVSALIKWIWRKREYLPILLVVSTGLSLPLSSPFL